jgi:hypothetical protein
MGLTFEKIWALFQETNIKFRETDRELKEMALQIKKMSKETDRQIKENSRLIGKLGGRLGDLVEHLVIPNILEKFNERGYGFGRAGPHVRYHGPDGKYIAEVDILLENGDTVLAVEVKTTLTDQDVKDHVERMNKLRRYADERKDERKLLGAITGAIASPGVKTFALRKGFFVLEQTGDTMQINVPDDFKPRIW